MTRNDKIRDKLLNLGINVDNPQLRIREGSSGAHTIPANYAQVFDQEIDSIRVRAFLPASWAKSPRKPMPRFFGKALEAWDIRKRSKRKPQP